MRKGDGSTASRVIGDDVADRLEEIGFRGWVYVVDADGVHWTVWDSHSGHHGVPPGTWFDADAMVEAPGECAVPLSKFMKEVGRSG